MTLTREEAEKLCTDYSLISNGYFSPADELRERGLNKSRKQMKEEEYNKKTAQAGGNVRFSSRDISSVESDISGFVDDALAGVDSEITITLASAWDNSAINKLGRTWQGKYKGSKRKFTAEYVRHVINQHGNSFIEALRGQMHMDPDAIKIALSRLRKGDGRVIGGTFSTRNLPTVLTRIPINGYTLYAEEPLQIRNETELQGRTMYMAPTATTALLQPERAANYRKGANGGSGNSIRGTDRIVNGYLTDPDGNRVKLNYYEKNGSPATSGRQFLTYALCSDVDTLRATQLKNGTVSAGEVRASNPYIVSGSNPIIVAADVENGEVGERIAEIKDQGYDAIVMDYAPGDNYFTIVFDKSQIEKTQFSSRNDEVQYSVRDNGTEKETAQAGGVQLSPRGSHYDYSKSFAEQIDDYKAGKIPQRDSLIVSGTPDIWEKVGLNSLPVTINQRHVDYALNGTKDADHFIGELTLKDLPNLIKRPIAIIQSQTEPGRAVVIIRKEHLGNKIIAAVEVDGYGHQNNYRIDSNAITSIYGKTAALENLKTAVANTASGKVELFYWNKREAVTLLQGAGLQLPRGLPQDGFVHSIRDIGSNVKVRFHSQLESTQFKRWFGKSKVVNDDGSPIFSRQKEETEYPFHFKIEQHPAILARCLVCLLPFSWLPLGGRKLHEDKAKSEPISNLEDMVRIYMLW